jgi:hypothetical protein
MERMAILGSEKTEMEQLAEYKHLLKKEIEEELLMVKRCHMSYYVKHDGRHKTRLVPGGHMTDPSTESVYSGVISLCGIRPKTFLVH